jgi:hypothetical protein
MGAAADQAAAVVAAAGHLATTRERLAALLADDAADQRGYCSPSEDEAFAALWVDWWRARQVLSEVITVARDEFEGEEDPRWFAVGYGAAVVLVAAARWLYADLRGRPVWRRRANQAMPEFAVPARSFERIARGLTRARHLWRLAIARQWRDRHSAVLTKAAVAGPFVELLALIEAGEGALAISRRRVVAAHVRVRARRAGAVLGRRVFGGLLYRIQRWAGCVVAEIPTRVGHQPALPTRQAHALTKPLLPGYWPHAILYLGDGARVRALGGEPPHEDAAEWVLEAQADGVRLRPWQGACDAIAVLRPVLADEVIATGLQRGLAHVGKPYDFAFDFRTSHSLVCSEVVYRAYDGLAGLTLPLVERLGRPTLAPQDLLEQALDDGVALTPCWAWVPDCSPVAAGPDQAPALLARSIGREAQ